MSQAPDPQALVRQFLELDMALRGMAAAGLPPDSDALSERRRLQAELRALDVDPYAVSTLPFSV